MAEVGRVVLFGRIGSGKSTVANMLVSGKLEDCPVAPIGHGLWKTTSTCTTYVGRGWTVIDTMGFGEPDCGAMGIRGCQRVIVPDEDVRKIVIDFLKGVKGRYTHIMFVQEWGILDKLDTIIWETFRQVFSGGEESFGVLFTKVQDPDAVHENWADIQKAFPGCRRFLFVDFPGFHEDSDMEEVNVLIREEELARLEQEMKVNFKANPWVEPDIFKMEDEEIKEKAGIILQQIGAFIKDLLKNYKQKSFLLASVIFVGVAQLIELSTSTS